ncbi:MAG TPA: hypothetical protein VME24_03510 [Alphaproteobacteria bacterium]|nr:hypothetical protein [Alphaproteobacteria bacterium]
MQDKLEETRRQFHEIRNLLGHLNLGIRDLEKQIAGLRISLEHRLERIEVALNLPPESARKESLPVHEDKEGLEILPPQRPGA